MRSTVAYAGFAASLGELLQQIETLAYMEIPDQLLLNQRCLSLIKNGRFAISILEREILKQLKKVTRIHH